MEDNVINCEDYKSDLVLSKDGLKDAASRNLNKQKCILEHAYHYHAFLQEMPPGEPPATGGKNWKGDALKTIKSLLNLHRGELREWHGSWKAVDAPFPKKHDKPGMWHDQFFPPHDLGATSTVLSKPASGGNGHSVRVAIVVGLADLFFDYGQGRSAKELYHVYTELRVFAHPRANTRPFRRMTHWWHWKRS